MEIFYLTWILCLIIFCLLILLIKKYNIIIIFLILLLGYLFFLLKNSVLYKFDKFTLDGTVCKNNNYINLVSYL